MSGFLGGVITGSNSTLDGDIGQAGQVAGFGTATGEGDISQASGFYGDLLSGNEAKEAQLLAPEISNIQKEGQQQIQTKSQFGNRSGGTNASAQTNIDSQRSNVNDMVSKLTGGAAAGLAGIGESALSTGLSANAQQAQESQEQLQDEKDSLLGNSITSGAGYLENMGLKGGVNVAAGNSFF